MPTTSGRPLVWLVLTCVALALVPGARAETGYDLWLRYEPIYAGSSLWNWTDLPGRVDARIDDYARANASIGINGTVLNNVNADARVLTRPCLEKAAGSIGFPGTIGSPLA